MLESIWDFVTSALFIAYTVGFYIGMAVGGIIVAVYEGVGQGPVCTQNERPASQAGPGGGP